MRVEQLTFTRFIAAISIVIFHYGKASPLFNNKYLSFLFKNANVGVSYFFILSGFVMIIAYANKGNVSFYSYIKNRLARIYPVYILTILLVFFYDKDYVGKGVDLFLSVLMLQSWLPHKALILNYPSWSISVEIFFFILFPFLLNRIYSRMKFRNIFIIVVLFWLMSQIVHNLIYSEVITVPFYGKKDMMYFPVLHLNEFLVGNLSGLFFIKYYKDYKKNYTIPIVVSLIIIMLLLKFPVGLNLHNGLLAVIFCPFIILLALSNDKITQFFSKKIFVFLGEISFGVYLLQYPVWMFFSDDVMSRYFSLHKDFDYTSSFLVRVLILLLVASLSYLYFEKPAKKLIKLYSN